MAQSRICLELGSTFLSGESALANIKWRQRSFVSLSGTQCLSLFVKKKFSSRNNFIAHFLFFSFLHTGRVFVFRIEFLIMCSLHNMYWTGFWRRVTVASLSFRSVAFQDDGVASRMETVQRCTSIFSRNQMRISAFLRSTVPFPKTC